MPIITSRVRKADAGDAEEILAMCKEMHAENGMFTMSDKRVKELIALREVLNETA